MTKFIGALLLVIVTICMPNSAPAGELEINQPPGTVPAALVDLMVVRPLFTAGALIPTSAFLATLPVTYTLNRDLQVAQVLVQKPWMYVGDRPLGIFSPGESITTRIDEKISEQYQEYFIQAGVNRPAVCIK
jgi:hypothetical protein